MSSALDSLDGLEQAAAPGSVPSPAQARREADARDPGEARAQRQARWAVLIPEGVQGKLRDDLEASLDLAHFTLGWPVNKLAGQLVRISSDVAQTQGVEPDDPKVGRAAALHMLKTIESAALSQNPFADASPDLERYVNKTSAYARTLGWTPQQIGMMVKGALVQTEGDKAKAAGLFASYVIEEAHERGHRGSVSLEQLPGYTDRGSQLLADEDPQREADAGADLQDLQVDRTAPVPRDEPDFGLPESPTNEPYAPQRLVTVYDARDDNNVLDAYTMRTDQLQADVEEREVRARIADQKLAIVDKIAASALKPIDYAVYRVMRDESYRIGSNADVDMPLSRVVQERLQYEKLQGADLALKRVQRQLAEHGLKSEGELSPAAKQRLDMSTDQAVEAGLAAKPKRDKKEQLLE